MSRALLMINPGWRAMVATNLSKTSMGVLTINKISTPTILGCQKQLLLAEELSCGLGRTRGLVTSAVKLSDDKKGADQASLAQKIDPKDAAAKKAAEEATKKALEKKRRCQDKGRSRKGSQKGKERSRREKGKGS